MVSTEMLFRIGDGAEEVGNFDLARRSFEQGAALGDGACLTRLAHMFDVGIGVAIDKQFAMRCYQRAWRRDGDAVAANNIAILYREMGNERAKFRWFKRAADCGDDDARLELAKCYLDGVGVRKSVGAALRHLNAAVSGPNICDEALEEARALLAVLRPRLVAGKAS